MIVGYLVLEDKTKLTTFNQDLNIWNLIRLIFATVFGVYHLFLSHYYTLKISDEFNLSSILSIYYIWY